MLTDIYFVRHAHSHFSLEDEATRPLSERGFADAKTVTDLLKEEGINTVASSSYVRAVQTVQGIADHLGVDVILDPRFRERDMASADHIFEPDEIPIAMERVFADPTYKYPGGESNQEVLERGVAALQDILQQHRGKKIAIGIHGHVMTIIMGHLDPQYDLNFWRQTTKPDIYKLSFDHDRFLGATRLGNF